MFVFLSFCNHSDKKSRQDKKSLISCHTRVTIFRQFQKKTEKHVSIVLILTENLYNLHNINLKYSIHDMHHMTLHHGPNSRLLASDVLTDFTSLTTNQHCNGAYHE